MIFLVIFLFFTLSLPVFAQEELAQESVPLENNLSVDEINELIEKEQYLEALSETEKLPEDNDSKILKAKIYIKMDMYSDAKKALKDTTGDIAETLKYMVKRYEGFIFFPNYEFYNQVLSDEYDLDYQRYGIYLKQPLPNNKRFFIDYGIYVYKSGNETHLTNVTNELIAGVKSRHSKNLEYNLNLGGKFYQFGLGNMLISDSWLKYYFNDKASIKVGYKRNNIEQSFLSAVGVYDGDVFEGQVCENKFFIDGAYKFSDKVNIKARIAYGLNYAQNLPTNQFLDGYVNLTRNFYNNQKNKFIQKVDLGIITQFYGYKYNLTDIPQHTLRINAFGEKIDTIGGYFSPSFYNANVLDFSLEGIKNELGLRYGLKGFVGEQISRTPDFMRLAWGFAPFIEYNLSNHVALNLSYIFTKYADSERHIFFVNTIIRGFKR